MLSALLVGSGVNVFGAENNRKVNPTYESVSVVIEDMGLSDDNFYTFSDCEMQVSPTEFIVMINGTFTSKAKGITKANSDYLPLRAVAESLGDTVTWEEKTQGIIVNYGNTKFQVNIDKSTAIMNGKEVIMGFPNPQNGAVIETPPILVDAKTYLPVSFMAACFDKEIVGDGGMILRVNTDMTALPLMG